MAPDRMKCPFCDEEISTNARKCKHCGEWLVPAARPQAPSSGASDSARAVAKGIKKQKQDEGSFTLSVVGAFFGLGLLAYVLSPAFGGFGYFLAFIAFIVVFLKLRKSYYSE